MSALRTALEQFDGTHTAALVAALDVARGDMGLLAELCADCEVAVGATWVVKALVERGDAVDLAGVFATLGAQREWAAQLHILQCVHYAPEAAVSQLSAIRLLLDAPKALVKVWALDAFVRVADVDKELRGEAAGLVAAALEAKAASLRARARQLKKFCAAW